MTLCKKETRLDSEQPSRAVLIPFGWAKRANQASRQMPDGAPSQT
jgi:hypothetical protein